MGRDIPSLRSYFPKNLHIRVLNVERLWEGRNFVPTNNIPNTRRNMHQRTLLTQRETRSNTQRQPDRLCEERPAAEVPVYDETGEDGFDLWYTAACCLSIPP